MITPTIIRPIPPISTMPLPHLPEWMIEKTAEALFASGVVLLASYFIKRKLKAENKAVKIISLVFPSIIAAVLTLRFGVTVVCLKGIVLLLILLYASIRDIQTRTLEDSIPVMTAILALAGTELSALPGMLIASVIVTLPQFAIAVIKPGSYGGADIKLMAACVLLLGLAKGFVAIIIGLLLAVIVNLIMTIIKKKSIKSSFALIPYLSIGVMTAYML